MLKPFPLFLSFFIIACGQQGPQKKVSLPVEGEGKTSLLVLGATDTQSLRNEAKALGIEVEGETIVKLTGDAAALRNLEVIAGPDFQAIQDSPVMIETNQSFRPDKLGLYQAKKDFGIYEFQKQYPLADGRGVKVGVIDDGISPHQSGFFTTSTGERKILRKGSQSTFTTFDLRGAKDGFEAYIDESRNGIGAKLDLNGDGKFEPWYAFVSLDGKRICLDINNNRTYEEQECRGSFSETNDYLPLLSDPRLALIAEVDLENKKLQVFQTEKGGDSHGEGVASVLAGHKIGNIEGFDGVAPGAQILDYDLSELSHDQNESSFTIGTILRSIEWMGINKAEVANISYSLFFTSAKSQIFMASAIDKLVKKYNMVVSFSAGNNGPGLGSLNRRMIYPDSVLVAGAYVSPELDERVHGVTGIPEEGRVVFYSSRGMMASGPTLISPLSSLTHSTPDSGYSAFNGTSSASPALAGAAAVLISALKQQKLPIDAPTVVHALRLAGKRLKDEPFIFQGYGLPDLTKAIESYKKLIKGETFLYVKASTNKNSRDGVTLTDGLFFKASSAPSVVSRVISLSGAISELAPAAAKVNLLIPVAIEYPEGIRGPRELWVSQNSRMSIDIDVRGMLLQSPNEAFGEIKIKSQLDNSLLAIIPVTAIDDRNIATRPSGVMTVGSQEGQRLHVDVGPGVAGFKIKAKLLEGSDEFLELAVYSPHQVRTHYLKFRPEHWVATPQAGHYQIALIMNRGTAREAIVEFEFEPVEVLVLNDAVSTREPKIIIENLMDLPAHLDVSLTPKPQVLKRVIYTNKDFTKIPEITGTFEKGTYQVRLTPFQNYELNYSYANCFVTKENSDGTIETIAGAAFSHKEEKPVKATFRCIPFDVFKEGDTSLQWQLSLSQLQNGQVTKTNLAAGQKREIRFNKLQPGTYSVGISDSISGDRIVIGEVEAVFEEEEKQEEKK